ncbi:transmembrane protein 248 [Esox lucius]|nr:transmembrane protein 248 [Esox lucius]XP_010894661.1 transmembrane protein 248 [Esox lucius]
MGSWHPIANLKEYVYEHPPGVIFFLCVLTLALTFLSFGSYTHTHRLPNPDTPQDWNHFLSSLAHLQLCAKANGVGVEMVSSTTFGQEELGGTAYNSTQSPPSITHLSLSVPLAVMHSSDSQSMSNVHLRAMLLASQLGLTGNETVNVTLMFSSQPVEGNLHTCLTISAPTHILPLTLRPPVCSASEGTSYPVKAVATDTSSLKPPMSESCYILQYTPDSTLTAMLTQKELGLAGRHLIQVSICLLGVCVLLFLSASLTHTHTRRDHNGLDHQTEPLMDS